MVRQLGTPRFFWIMAPHEWSARYHECIRDVMRKSLRVRLHLPVAESLHLAHVLLNIAKGFIAVSGDADAWTNHRLQCSTGNMNVFIRLEFQDATRKALSQEYHGSGRIHLHMLGFASRQQMESINWARVVSRKFSNRPQWKQRLSNGAWCVQMLSGHGYVGYCTEPTRT